MDRMNFIKATFIRLAFVAIAFDGVRLRPLPERRRTHTARPADASEDSSDAYRQADLTPSFCSLLVRHYGTKPRRSESLFFLGPHTHIHRLLKVGFQRQRFLRPFAGASKTKGVLCRAVALPGGVVDFQKPLL